jgi:hypothetical protein
MFDIRHSDKNSCCAVGDLVQLQRLCRVRTGAERFLNWWVVGLKGGRGVRTYFFHLRTPAGVVYDPEGTALADETAARSHAKTVARELMANREGATRCWRLDVWDDEGQPRFELIFASVDETIGLPPEIRESWERFYGTSASLYEAIDSVKRSVEQVRGTLARAERPPYIAAIQGVSVWQTRNKPSFVA